MGVLPRIPRSAADDFDPASVQARLELCERAAGRAAAKGEGPCRPLNPEWDAQILDLLARANLGAFDGFRDEEIRGDGGSGGAEIRAWQAAFAALASAGRYEAELLFYRPIPEWIVGMGVMHAHLS